MNYNYVYDALISFVSGILVASIVISVIRHSRNKDKYGKIERIDRMRAKGQLTQEEFDKEKAKILQGS